MISEDAPVVLIVDDAPATRYIVGSWLRRGGFRVVEADTGGAALDTLHRQPVDLVVLDVGLPDMTGFEVCEIIKTDPTLGTPVVHLSATSVAGRDRAHGLDRGADAYLTDPVEPAELIATVNSVLRYHRARTDAEELARKLAALSRATMAMNASLEIDTLVAAIAAGAAEISEGPAIAMVPNPGDGLRVATTGAPTEPPRLSSAAPALLAGLHDGDDPRLLHPVVDDTALTWPDPDAPGTSWAMLARSRPGQPPVCLAVRAPERPPSGLAEVLVQLGNAAVLAVENQRLYAEEHNLALTLQRSFLPERFPDSPGLEIAVRYLPAVKTAEVGGDFYEMIELGEDRLLVAIGDVAGHSIHAATVMIELRHALRAYAIDGHDPTAVLDRLERTLLRFHRNEFATLCLLLLDPRADLLHIANAGHPPPLLVTADGADYAPASGPMLGIRLPRPAATAVPLGPVRSIVMFTDGLVEDRPVDIDDALRRLRAHPGLDAHPEDVCDSLLADFGQDKSDDIALLVLRRTAATG